MSETAAETILLIAHSDWRDGRLVPLLKAKGYDVAWCCPALGASRSPETSRNAIPTPGCPSGSGTERERDEQREQQRAPRVTPRIAAAAIVLIAWTGSGIAARARVGARRHGRTRFVVRPIGRAQLHGS